MRYPVKHYGVGGVLDQAFQVLQDNFTPLFKMVAVTIIPYQIIAGMINEGMQQKNRAGLPPTMELLAFLVFTVAIGIPLLFLANAALYRAVSRMYLSKPTSLQDSFKVGMNRFLPLLGTSILVGIAAGVGFLFCILPSLVAVVMFALAAPVSVLESKAGPDAMTRSWNLVKSNIGPLIVLGLVQFAIALQITVIAGLIPQLHLRLVVAGVLQGISHLLQTSGMVVFYYSCRCQLENFDLWLLADSIEAGEDPMEEIVVTPA